MFNITSTLPVKRRWKDAQGNEFIETGAMLLATGYGGFVSVKNSIWQVPEDWPHATLTPMSGTSAGFELSMKVPKLVSIDS